MSKKGLIDTHNKVVTFGKKYRGERWTRVPVSYLRYIANEFAPCAAKQLAIAELARRGTTIPSDVELSGHALDRASQITDEWKTKGVYSWLTVIAGEAAEQIIDSEVVLYKGYKFVFKLGDYYPVLKTIIKKESGVADESSDTTGGEETSS